MMTDIDRNALDRSLDVPAHRFAGPGGVAGVVKDGKMIARRAWGCADLAARRSMDAPAPGDWILQVRHNAAGMVSGLTLGCWLARGID